MNLFLNLKVEANLQYQQKIKKRLFFYVFYFIWLM